MNEIISVLIGYINVWFHEELTENKLNYGLIGDAIIKGFMKMHCR